MSNRAPLSLSPQALRGLRVLELGQLIAGPFAGRMLADFGADVIKIEPPGGGDPLRGWRLLHAGTSLWWEVQSRNKRSVALDLRDAQAQQMVRDLAREADVLIENFRPGTLEGWGLGWDVLHALNPRLVMLRISGYGQTGPYREQPGFGVLGEAMGGLRYLTGEPDRPSVRVGVSIGDTLAALHGLIGVLIALRHRDVNGGLGQAIDVALYEAVFNCMESLLPEFSAFGAVRQPAGAALPGITPSNAYPCADGSQVLVAANGDSIYRRLMTLIGRTDLADDSQLAHNEGRSQRAAELDAAIAAWTGTLPVAQVLERLAAAHVPAGRIYTVRDIAADPHYRARGVIERTRTQSGLELEVPGVIPKLSATPGCLATPAPTLGQHNDEVLAGRDRSAHASAVEIREVVARDGLQNEARFVATDDKLALIEALVAAGVRRIEATSFASPKAIPALRDADELMQRLSRHPGVRYDALVPNLRGAERALAAGVDGVNLVLSVSESHNLANLRMTREQSAEQLAAVAKMARAAGKAVEVGVSTAFRCPFEGAIDADEVLRWVERCADWGVSAAALCDTTGAAHPAQVARLFERARAAFPQIEFVAHLHDTRGLALANALAAYQVGVRRFDAALGGLGGCPYAPGASGNVCTEDLVHMFEQMGVATGIDLAHLLRAAERLPALVGRSSVSHVLRAGAAERRYPLPAEAQQWRDRAAAREAATI